LFDIEFKYDIWTNILTVYVSPNLKFAKT